MLWVNLIMDTFAALALATEKPTDDMIKGKPQSRNENIMNLSMWRNVIGQAIFQIAVLSVFLFFGDFLYNIEKKQMHEEWTF